jgi:hypothetical protein
MRITAAQLPPRGGDDAIVTTGQAVIMLDGASAFTPMPVPASVYAGHLAQQLAKVMDARPEDDLRGTLADSIAATARDLDLRPGKSPSSAVIILRRTGMYVDCLVLGDSLAILAGHPISDDRLAQIGRQLRGQYRGRLAEGLGYDQEHRRILQELQREQARHRNQPGGYWIAEADPQAAEHALVTQYPADTVPWAVLATDGAYKTMTHLGLADWSALCQASRQDLADMLQRCQTWEAIEDPDGQKLTRAKRHDDKSLAVAELSRTYRA